MTARPGTLPAGPPAPEADRRWPRLLDTVLRGRDLTPADTAWLMDSLLRGEATPAQIAGLLVALRAKGETVDELQGLADGMLAHAVPMRAPDDCVDVVGTGGDGACTVNISTMSAIVAAGAGARVVKHGARAASSRSGSADVLEELGVTLRLPPERLARLAETVGIAFCFAPDFHPAMRHAALPRRELGIPTVFNALGPLTNPARPRALAVGVADARLAPLIAGVLARRGTEALVFRGDDGLDELTVTTTSHVWCVSDGRIREERFDPRETGIPFAPAEALRGGDAAHNAEVARRLLAGRRGPVRDAVLLSAAATLAAAAPSTAPLADRLRPALAAAAESIDSGAAEAVLREWVGASAAPAPGEVLAKAA
ncbi:MULTISPECIES: anthranilate phosphoribosyltransferase [unclassified Streptomyces]|uniref:anthranilate phosphoribosyltransferase n=1 Tax=unclassified Streptomyces TaxID=2593676 RepID=UPI0004C98BF3|nr:MULTISPECIES: anthranilate phosphoribosyltransferase [unclassified Streptomyces]KOV72481.1 anthranilate phosphoribosyltransferase [Streptomyces sp. NRRL WC-3723]